MFRSSLIIAFVGISLAACGGGSGGGTGGGTGSGAGSGAGSGSSSQIVTESQLVLTSIDLNFGDTLASLEPDPRDTSSVVKNVGESFVYAYASYLIDMLFPKAFAQGVLQELDNQAANQITRRFFNGALESLNLEVIAYELDVDGNSVLDEEGNPKEVVVACDLTTAEINISTVRLLNTQDESVIVSALVPVQLNNDCVVEFEYKTIIVNDGNVFDISDEFTLNTETLVIPANDSEFNRSDTALINFPGSSIVSAISLEQGVVVISDLTPSTIEIKMERGGFIYNGEDLIALGTGESAPNDVVLFSFEKGSTEFTIYRPAWGSYPLDAPSMSWLVFGSDEEEILVHSGTLFFLDIENKQITRITNSATTPQICMELDDLPPECLFRGNLNAGQRLLGRYGDWLIDTEGALNYKTGAYTGQLGCLPQISLACGNAGQFFDRINNNLYVVDDNSAKFIRFDLETGSYSLVNLDNSGYLASSYTVTKDYALVEIINSANSNAEYVQVSFLDGSIVYLGLISEGERNVTSFYSPSS